MEFLKTGFSGCEIIVLGRTQCGFPRHKKTWEILGYGFQDLRS
jgi:hypothetical protein